VALQAQESDVARREEIPLDEDRSLRRARFLYHPLARFVLLRWFAACAVLVAPVILNVGLGLHIPILSTSIIAAMLATMNLAYFVALERLMKAGWMGGIRWMGPLQAAIDLVTLSLLLFLTGGIRNPLLMFFVFHVIITGILFERTVCFSVAVFGALLVIVECAAEFLMPGLSPDIFGLGPIGAPEHLNYILCILAVFSMTLFVTAYLTCDIAGRLRREEVRLAVATVAKLEEAKSRLLYFVAHEMKSPLVAITSCLQAAASVLEKRESTPDGVADMLERAKGRSNQMAALVKELLELSRQRSAPKDVARTRIGLKPLLQTVVDDQREAAQKKGIAFRMSVCDGAVDASGDAESLQRAFTNLVRNAIQYTPEAGEIEVAVNCAGDGVEVVVKDTGIGIPEEALEDIFQEFYRCSNAKKVSCIGTGLGLSIVKSIVENQGGRIVVESEIGEGSKFTVCLPQAGDEQRQV